MLRKLFRRKGQRAGAESSREANNLDDSGDSYIPRGEQPARPRVPGSRPSANAPPILDDTRHLSAGRTAVPSGGPFVSTADGSKFDAPDETKVATDFAPGSPPAELYPVLRWGDYTYWPLSYIDNRFSMALVVTNSLGHVIRTFQLSGARYIREINLNMATQEVIFVGQARQTAVLSWKYLHPSIIAQSSPTHLPHTVSSTPQPPPPVSPPPASPPPASPALVTVAEGLDSFFLTTVQNYTDSSFEHISNFLSREGLGQYHESPRLYTILRRLNCLEDMDRFPAGGWSDVSLPFSPTQLPSDFSEGWKRRFLQEQQIICSNSDIILTLNMGKHMTFQQNPSFLMTTKKIGRGARGQVDEVWCAAGNNAKLARKRIYRRFMSVDDGSIAAAFKKEVETMKRISHHHCTKLVRLKPRVICSLTTVC